MPTVAEPNGIPTASVLGWESFYGCVRRCIGLYRGFCFQVSFALRRSLLGHRFGMFNQLGPSASGGQL